MRKRFYVIVFCIALLITFIPSTVLAYDPGSGKTYNDNDYNKLKAFLNLTSDDGVHTNGWRLNPAYDPDDPTTWGVGIVVEWTDGDTDKRVSQLLWGSNGLKGDLDLSGFTSLNCTVLDNNHITSVNVTGDIAMGTLSINSTDITTLDASGLSSLKNFSHINCGSLTSVDVSGCTALESVNTEDSIIDTLKISGCTQLKTLELDRCKLTNLDFTGCSSIENIIIEGDKFTTLDLTGCTALKGLNVKNTDLSSLDVSHCTSLTYLDCEGSTHLTSLTIKGASNLDSVNCPGCALKALDASGLTKLTNINCSANNDIETLDITGDTALETLDCSQNKITEIKGLSDAAGIRGLACSNNAIGELGVKGKTALTALACDHNQLTSLDMFGDTGLYMVECEDNKISSLNTTGNDVLALLLCQNNLLKTLDLSGSTELQILDSTGNRLTSAKAVFSGKTVSLDAKGAGYVELYNNTYENGYYANAVPLSGETFINWTSSGSEVSATSKYVLSGSSSYDITANFTQLAFTDPPSGNINTGGSLKLTPNHDGGTWDFDTTFFSRDGNTFTGLKAGKTQIKYTWGEESITFDVTIPANITPLAFIDSPSGSIYTGGRLTLTPNKDSGTWAFDTSYISRDGNTFTGLKAGKTQIKYTLGEESITFDVTITASSLPQTGQDLTLFYALLFAGVIAGAAGIVLFRLRKA